MDGQVVSQEETLAMFNKFTSFMDYIRNQLVNNTELAQKVEMLTAQVEGLTSQIHNVVGQNTALQEAVNVLTRERDDERETSKQLQEHAQDLREKFNTRDNDANHWYAEFQRVSQELEAVKAERSKLEEDHLALMDVHEKVKAKLEKIQSVLGPLATVEEIKNREPQPRDPLTQQWRSPYDDRQVG